MDLLEYQGKQLFRDHGVPTPEGQPAQPAEAGVRDWRGTLAERRVS